jgi:hypothetical protein
MTPPGRTRERIRHACGGISAVQLNDEDLVAAASDQRLLAAWPESGIATFDSNATHGPADETIGTGLKHPAG